MPPAEPDRRAGDEAAVQLGELQALATLGTLAAGLAHDLNNSTTTLLQAARQLPGAIAVWQTLTRELGELHLTPDERTLVDQLHAGISNRVKTGGPDNPLDRSDAEAEIVEWLESRDISNPWQLGPNLVDAGWTATELTHQAQALAPDHLDGVLQWLGQGCLIYQLLHSLSMSALAISETTTAVRSQVAGNDAETTRMESIPESIERTLVILRGKLRGVTIVRDEMNIPHNLKISSEINQILTNLVDNAANALDGEGTLTIRAHAGGGWITIEVEDDGPGVSDDVRGRLFEPFISTKAPGQATGLGLHISRQIARRHGGDITVESQPGKTRFIVRIAASNDTGGPDG